MEEKIKDLSDFYESLVKKISKDFPKDNPDDVKKSLNDFWNSLLDVITKKLNIPGN